MSTVMVPVGCRQRAQVGFWILYATPTILSDHLCLPASCAIPAEDMRAAFSSATVDNGILLRAACEEWSQADGALAIWWNLYSFQLRSRTSSWEVSLRRMLPKYVAYLLGRFVDQPHRMHLILHSRLLQTALGNECQIYLRRNWAALQRVKLIGLRKLLINLVLIEG